MFRSLLFIPGNNKRFIKKSAIIYPDILCFDLEDSVPFNEKTIARNLVKDLLANRQINDKSATYVRINSIDSGLIDDDLNEIINEGLDGIVLPKTSNKQQVIQVIKKINSIASKRKIDSKIRIIPSIETAKGVINANSISSAHKNVVAIVFGVFDYLHDMNLQDEYNNYTSYNYARSKIPVDAKAADIYALDGIWQKVNDIEGLMKDAMLGKKLGYSGKTLIHPSHINSIHKIFRPTKKQIEWAKKVFAALQDSMDGENERGAILLEGRMIDAVHYKQAKAILDTSMN